MENVPGAKGVHDGRFLGNGDFLHPAIVRLDNRLSSPAYRNVLHSEFRYPLNDILHG